MKLSALLVIAARTSAGVLALASSASGPANEKDASIYGVTLPPGYCDWRLIWVTHEEGDFNQLRVQLGNDVAIKAHREGKPPFPDGTIIAVLDRERFPSEEERVWPRSGFRCKKVCSDGRRLGVRVTLRTANLPTRRSTKLVSLATSLPKLRTSSILVTQPFN